MEEERNLNELNPKLKIDDRIVIIYLQGEESTEDLDFGETKAKVLEIVNQPKFKQTDPGYGYYCEFYKKNGDLLAKWTLLPEADAWIYDKEYYENKQIEESYSFIRKKDIY